MTDECPIPRVRRRPGVGPPILPPSLRGALVAAYAIYRDAPPPGEPLPRYVVHRWTIGPTRVDCDREPFYRGPLSGAYRAIPAECSRMVARSAEDDPELVETWI